MKKQELKEIIFQQAGEINRLSKEVDRLRKLLEDTVVSVKAEINELIGQRDANEETADTVE